MNETEDFGGGELEADLRSAFAGESAAATATTATPVTPDKPVDASTEVKDTASDNRDEKGRFKVKDATADATVDKATAQPVLTKTTDAPADKPADETAQTSAIRPPSTWSIAAKAKFATLDPEIQKEVIKREEDIFKGLDEYKQGHHFAQSMQKALTPYMATIQSLGVTPDVAIQQLLSVDHGLRHGSPEQKLNTIVQIANQFGIDLKQFATEQPQGDPVIASLRQEINQLKQHLNQQHSQSVSAEQQHIQGEIAKFQQDPTHLYFDDVRAEMGALMTSGRAKGLQEAYEQACWAHPQIRDVLLRQQNEEGEKKRLAEVAQKAEAAKRAGFDVKGTGATHSADNRELSLVEELRQHFG